MSNTQAELHVFKVKKLDACIRPLFAILAVFVIQGSPYKIFC